jgi:hypothetical protein
VTVEALMKLSDSILSLTSINLIVFLVCLMLGSPYLGEGLVWTYVLSLVITILGFVPLIIKSEGDIASVCMSLIDSSPYTLAHGSCYGTLLGAWIFSIFFPLDNGSIMQQWPIASLLGTVIGCLLGGLIVWTCVCKHDHTCRF